MLSIRFAQLEDAPLLATLIRELAEYDRLSQEAIVTEEDVARDGFGSKPKFRALIAEWDGAAAGYACFFEIYSTFQGRAGLFLDDIFVRPSFRQKGIGKALLGRVAKIALEEGYFCVRFETLGWNASGIEFFGNLGAVFMDEWKAGLLIGDVLEAVANESK
jgi:GNAT superfamily N-acetyltransferase